MSKQFTEITTKHVSFTYLKPPMGVSGREERRTREREVSNNLRNGDHFVHHNLVRK